MIHTPEGTLQSYLDGALPGEERRSIGRHVDECATCAAELESLREAGERFRASVVAMDVEAPAADRVHAEILRRHWSRRSDAARRVLARAAGLIVLLGAAAAVAMPGSPVRAWIGERLGSSDDAIGLEPSAPVVEPAPEPTSGVAVLPAGGRVRIVIEPPAASTLLYIRIVDGGAAAVQAADEMTARFTTAPGEIRVVDPSGGVLIVEVPRAATDVSVRVADRVLLSGTGRDYRLGANPITSTTDEVVFEIDS